ncbi:MAG: hypothetical protein AB1446_10895 [Bacillota bacterium]
MPQVASNRGILLAMVMLTCLAVLCASCLTGCGPGPAASREPSGGGPRGGGEAPGSGQTPGAGVGDGVSAPEWTPGEAGAVEVRREGNVATAGPFRQLLGVTWVSDEEFLALARHQGGESIVRFSRDRGGAWTGRAVLTLKQDALPEGFYMWAPLADGKSIVFTTLRESVLGPLWRYDIEPSGVEGRGVYKVTEPVNAVFRMSPDRARAVLYDNEGASMTDFRTGQKVRLPGVPSYEFPFVGIGCSWSPDGVHYLYQVVEGQVARWFGIVRTDTGTVVCRVAPGKGCAFEAAWSPDGSRVAFLVLDGEGDTFLGPEDELIPPIAHRVGILEVGTGRVEYVSVPGKLVYGLPVWSPVGGALAFAAGTVEGSRTSGFRVSCDVHIAQEQAGQWVVTQVTGPAQGKGAKLPLSWAPDGTALAFSAPSLEDEQCLWVGVVRSPGGSRGAAGSWLAPVMLGEVVTPVTWLDDHTLVGKVVLPGKQPHVREIRVFSADGKVVSTVDGPAMFRELTVSPGGGYLAYTWDAVITDGSEPMTLLRIMPMR